MHLSQIKNVAILEDSRDESIISLRSRSSKVATESIVGRLGGERGLLMSANGMCKASKEIGRQRRRMGVRSIFPFMSPTVDDLDERNGV